MDINHEQMVWAKEDNEKFFEESRSKVEDLYPSETFFLPEVLKEVRSCLDVGCCCGGFCNIMKTFNPELDYTGTDIIPRFIEIAKEKFPEANFAVNDGANLDFPDNSFELAHSTGVLHVNSEYVNMIKEMYRVSSRYFLADLRITLGQSVTGTMRVNLLDQEGEEGSLPYFVLNLESALDIFKNLTPKPKKIIVKGYATKPTGLASIELDNIYMPFFLVTKGDSDTEETEVQIELSMGAAASSK